jgi:hypothetical protein
MKMLTLTVAVALGIVACGRSSVDDPPPTLVRYEIAEGVPSCADCPLTGPRVTPGADGFLVLRLNATYTARAFVRTTGRPDRCIYKVFSYSWWLPVRDFLCTPERVDMIINEAIGTADFLVERDRFHRITVALSEYDIDARSNLSTQRLHDFPVRFVP